MTVTATRPTIDASRLPAEVRDGRTPAWWGNVLFMTIETTTVALLLASYFYLWRNYPQDQWPPPQGNTDPPILKPVPDLLLGTVNVLLLVATVPLMRLVDRRCGRQFDDLEKLHATKPSKAPPGKRPPARPRVVMYGMLAVFALGCISLVLRWHEFPALNVRWNENAYASLVWSLLGLHFVYIAIEVVEIAVLFAWAALFEVGENQAGDIILTAEYWYWTVGVGVVIYAVVYWFPRVV
jgi:heme/copper-type cytochrome/quinol oxidase subunit 3